MPQPHEVVAQRQQQQQPRQEQPPKKRLLNTVAVCSLKARLVRTSDAGKYLGMKPGKVRALIASGKLPFIQEGLGCPFLVDIADLDCWIEDHKKIAE